MLKHVNDKECFGDEEERQKEVPATDKHPTLAANEARLRIALPSIAGTWKLRTLHHEAISISLTDSTLHSHSVKFFNLLFLGSLLQQSLLFSQALIYHFGPFKWMGSKGSWAGPILHPNNSFDWTHVISYIFSLLFFLVFKENGRQLLIISSIIIR